MAIRRTCRFAEDLFTTWFFAAVYTTMLAFLILVGAGLIWQIFPEADFLTAPTEGIFSVTGAIGDWTIEFFNHDRERFGILRHVVATVAIGTFFTPLVMLKRRRKRRAKMRKRRAKLAQREVRSEDEADTPPSLERKMKAQRREIRRAMKDRKRRAKRAAKMRR